MNYNWPGNIRELANVLERAQILAEGSVITPDDLPENLITGPVPTRAEIGLERPFDLDAFATQSAPGLSALVGPNDHQEDMCISKILEDHSLGLKNHSFNAIADRPRRSPNR